ncbi:replication initiation protein RepC [Sulfitobacter sp. M22298]|jgi:replication initiation protein RepC|uniref:replication initiation protein RepC n=1 Tax=Sulfitobacter sp. M22298 TaxID=3368575 RepID=UPI00374527F8
MQACPEFASRARNTGGFFKDWGDMHRFADHLMLMVGISEHAWNVTQERMGTQVATAAFALVFEKHGTGEVASPGGWRGGMAEEAGARNLHLKHCFYCRLDRKAT